MATRRPPSVIALIALSVTLGFAGLAEAKDPGPKDSEEPPLEFTLTIDGKPIQIRADEPAKVKVNDREVEVRLTAKPDRLLKVPGLSFRYPAGHGFEFERLDGSGRWTLDGNDNVVILSRVPHKIDPAEMVRNTVEPLTKQFGPKNVQASTSEMRLGGRAYPATHLTVTVRSERLIYNLCALNAGRATFVLMVQDSPKADGSPSDETRRVLELLDKTLKVDD